MTARDRPEVGDITSVVITSLRSDRDPAGEIDGKICFVRFPGDERPEFGESVRVKIADERENVYIGAAVTEDE